MDSGHPGTDNTIRVEFRPLAALKKRLPGPGKGSAMVEAPAGTTLSEFLARMGVDCNRSLVVLKNGRYAPPESELVDGDVVSVFPPLTGG